MKAFKGMGVALMTPFTKDGTVDEQALKKLVRFQLENKTDYIVVLGTTGEYVTLTKEEREKVKSIIVSENKGQLPLVLGIGGNNTAAVCQQLQNEDSSGFDALLSVSPYYNKPSQEGIYRHFKAVAEHSPRPVMIYNVPGRTSSNISPDTVGRLARDFNNIIGIKEAAGDIVQAMEVIAKTPDDFQVISGDDMLALPMTVAGGDGVISVIGGAFPKEFSKIINLGLERKIDDAYTMLYQLMPVINMAFEEGNPVGVKAIVHQLGLAELTVRLPLIEATIPLQEKVGEFVDEYYK